jgi:hypothetical protein
VPASIRIIRAKDFIHATPRGEVKLGKSEEMLERIVSATRDLDQFQILIDVRRATGKLTPQELWVLAQRLQKYRTTFSQRTAVLTPFERKERAEFFALCAGSSGFNIQVFTSYEDAMRYLLDDEEI